MRNLLFAAVAAAGIAGTFASTAGAVHPGGVAVAAVAGLVLAGLTVVADDLIDLFASPSSTTPGCHTGTS